MPAGFQCIGDNGNIQIDENYSNMVLVASGTLGFNNNINDNSPLYLSYTGTSPILFTRSSVLFVHMVQTRRSGNTWTWTLIGAPEPNSGNYAENVPYYIFDVQPNVETHCGLNVYAADGRVVFNSDYRPMKVRAVFPAVDTLASTSANTKYVASGGSGVYAGMLASPFEAYQQVSAQQGLHWVQGCRMAGGNQFQTQISNTGTGPPANIKSDSGIGIVVDVG